VPPFDTSFPLAPWSNSRQAQWPRHAQRHAGYRTRVRSGVNKMLRGGAAGLSATGAMSGVLGIADKIGIMDQQPPRRIVANGLAVAAHLGYGMAAGVAFSCLPERLVRSVPAGTAYGALVYAAGYEGWLPALGILPPAHRDQHRGRVATMLFSHLVYGASLAYAYRRVSALPSGVPVS
jgi:hypothetical protein